MIPGRPFRNALSGISAELLGKEAALLFQSGLWEINCLKCVTDPGDEVCVRKIAYF